MEISFGHPERERITFSISDDISEQIKKSSGQSVTAHVQIQSGGFTGNADLWLDVSDFARFAPEVQRLYETLKGDACFRTTENQIGLVLKGDGRGHIDLSGRLLDRCGDGNELLFKLDLDQTQLKDPITELEHFLKLATNRL